MTTNTYTSPFTGDIVQPTDVSYQALDLTADTQLAWPSYVPPNSGYVPLSRIIDVTPSADGWIINLPPGSQGSVGTDVLFRNIGSHSFEVNSFGDTQSSMIAAGEARYFYLTDNSTEEGVWANFTYGTGTSSADAAALAGNGLASIAGKLATSNTVITASAIPTLNDASRALTYVWTGGQDTLPLPAVTSISAGWYIMVRNGGSGTLNVVPQSPSTINDSPTLTLNPGDSGIIVFDHSGGAYYTVGYLQPTNASFSSATYDVDSIVGNTLNLVGNAPIIQTYVALAGTRTTTLAVTLPAITQIYVLSNNTSTSAYNITFQVSGSSQPPVVFAAGVTAVVLTDGTNLYILTQSSTGYYFASNGSASAPSFSFNSDLTTGMYLKTSHILGLSANATEMFVVDATNLSDLQVSTPATFNAALIGGGTF
jgi:hypothetical protein